MTLPLRHRCNSPFRLHTCRGSATALWSRERDGRYVLHRAAGDARRAGFRSERYGCVYREGGLWAAEQWRKCGDVVRERHRSKAEAQTAVLNIVENCSFDPTPAPVPDEGLRITGPDPYSDDGVTYDASYESWDLLDRLTSGLNKYLEGVCDLISAHGKSGRGGRRLFGPSWAETDLRYVLNEVDATAKDRSSQAHPVHRRIDMLASAAMTARGAFERNVRPAWSSTAAPVGGTYGRESAFHIFSSALVSARLSMAGDA